MVNLSTCVVFLSIASFICCCILPVDYMLIHYQLIFDSSESESCIMTYDQMVSLSSNKAPIWGLGPDFCYCQTVGLLVWGALSDQKTGLSFTIAAGPLQRNHSQV
jgi:hypothetical protein